MPLRRSAGGRGGEGVARRTVALASVTSLFFSWGFIASNNDPLIVTLRVAFSLSYTGALTTQLVFFLGYGLMSLPAASIGNRIGSVGTILLALATMIVGCLLMWPAAALNMYPPILAALSFWRSGSRLCRSSPIRWWWAVPPFLPAIHCAKRGGARTIRAGKDGRYRYYTCSTKARQGPPLALA